jgi:uncharacterized protein YidB (DUF937 family)
MSASQPSVFDALIDDGRLDGVDARLLAELVERLTGCGAENPIGSLVGIAEKAGLQREVRSWIGPGQPLPLPPDGMDKLASGGELFDQAWLTQVGGRLGIDQTQLARRLSRLIPMLVKTLTPRGEIPSSRVVSVGLESLRRRAAR